MESGGNRMMYPQLHIWRPTPHGIMSVILSAPMAVGGNLYNHTLATPIPVQHGDYLGIYQPQHKDSKYILYYQEYNGPINIYQSQDMHYPLVSAIIIGRYNV